MTSYITLDTPNIPILPVEKSSEIPYGEFINTVVDIGDIDPADGSFRSRDMYLPQVSIREFEGSFSKEVIFSNLHAENAELPGSCLLLRSSVKSYLVGGGHELASFERSQNFKFDPNNEYVHKCEANSDLHFFHVSYEPEYLSKLLPEGEAWADALRESIYMRSRVFGIEYKPLTATQLRAIQTIADCPLSGRLGEMVIEAAVTQIILMQLTQLFDTGQQVQRVGRINPDVELAFSLKDYLAATFLQDHSIEGLSRRFGVNANKLMANFKQAIGQSIFEYITELRMEHAVHLLQEKHARVSEIARALGYKNPNHFSTAFKRVFGVVPTEFRYRPGR